MDKRLFKPITSIKKVEKIYIFPESESRKHFHASGMHAIDFSHQITPNRVIFTKKILILPNGRVPYQDDFVAPRMAQW